jgi:hypothetical protein
MADFELSDSEQELLEECCRTLDQITRLEGSIADLGTFVTGSTGQPVMNPAIGEARGQRALLHKLLAVLALPDEEGQTIPAGVCQRARTAAQAKWRRQRGA